jgi:CBS domain-containing protein
MAQTVSEIMTTNLVAVDRASSLVEAAEKMRDRHIGDILVTEDGRVFGILTDRDIVLRGVAEGRSPRETAVGDVCTKNPTTLSPQDGIDRAVELMRKKAIRRLPVVQNHTLVGIVSLGDLAIERDRESALADISAARADR